MDEGLATGLLGRVEVFHHPLGPIEIALERFLEHLATVLAEVEFETTKLVEVEAADIVPREVIATFLDTRQTLAKGHGLVLLGSHLCQDTLKK